VDGGSNKCYRQTSGRDTISKLPPVFLSGKCYMSRLRQKKPTSDERWKGPGLINGGTTHPIRLVFWGEGNGPVTSGIRANPDPTPMSRQAPQQVG